MKLSFTWPWKYPFYWEDWKNRGSLRDTFLLKQLSVSVSLKRSVRLKNHLSKVGKLFGCLFLSGIGNLKTWWNFFFWCYLMIQGTK
jgi:hypothetical protein